MVGTVVSFDYKMTTKIEIGALGILDAVFHTLRGENFPFGVPIENQSFIRTHAAALSIPIPMHNKYKEKK